MIEMIDINKNHFEIKLFNFLKNNNFTNNFTDIIYLNEFFEVYKRIEIQRLIINYKLLKLKKNYLYLDSMKYEILINNKYLFNLVQIKNYCINKMFKKKTFYLNLIKK